jgi:hypothetical protein
MMRDNYCDANSIKNRPAPPDCTYSMRRGVADTGRCCLDCNSMLACGPGGVTVRSNADIARAVLAPGQRAHGPLGMASFRWRHLGDGAAVLGDPAAWWVENYCGGSGGSRLYFTGDHDRRPEHDDLPRHVGGELRTAGLGDTRPSCSIASTGCGMLHRPADGDGDQSKPRPGRPKFNPKRRPARRGDPNRNRPLRRLLRRHADMAAQPTTDANHDATQSTAKTCRTSKLNPNFSPEQIDMRISHTTTARILLEDVLYSVEFLYIPTA